MQTSCGLPLMGQTLAALELVYRVRNMLKEPEIKKLSSTIEYYMSRKTLLIITD